MRPLTVLLVLLVLIAAIQLMLPGLGDSWFGSGYVPSGWAPSQKWVYLLTELVPVLVFAVIGVVFWAAGGSTRAETVASAPVEVEAID